MKKKIALYHYQPIEKYPPILNLLQQIDEEEREAKIVVFTTYCSREYSKHFKRIKIVSVGTNISNRYIKKINYFTFNFLSVIFSIWFRPQKILYYESISCFPPFLISRFFKNREVFVHYHEYMTPEEYKKGMWLVGRLHTYEKKNLHKVKWLSHTNQDRLDFFLKDISLQNKIKAISNVLPNYPPKSWNTNTKRLTKNEKEKTRFVYVGHSLSTDTSYIKEFLEWLNLEVNVSLDAYIVEVPEELQKLEEDYKKNFKIHPSVSYSNLPETLQHYHIGLVLYKAHIPNCKYIAPNKLFEYCCCGLDVWYPEEVIGCDPYKTTDSYPKVLPVNFNNLHYYSLQRLTERTGSLYKPKEYSAEDVNSNLIDVLFS